MSDSSDSNIAPPDPLDFTNNPFGQQILDSVKKHPFLNRGEFGAPVTPVVDTTPPEAVTAAVEPEVVAEPAVDEPVLEPSASDAPQTPTYDPAEYAKLQALNDWARALKPEVAQQFGYIESGQAVAVPTDEFAAYQAWQRTQHQQQQAQQAPEWVADLDPDARRAFDQLQQQNSELQRQAQQANSQAQQALVPQHQAELDRRAAIFDGAIHAYATQHGFTDEAAGSLMDAAVKSGVIPNLLQAHRTYSPSGLLTQEADLSVVAQKALDYGRIQRPDLTPTAAPAPVVLGNVTPISAAPSLTPTDQKKILASHLATAPSAAQHPLGTAAGPLDMNQQRAVIADLLRSQGLAS